MDFRTWRSWPRNASSDEHHRHRAGLEWPRVARTSAREPGGANPARRELLVVDNGSTDGAPEMAKARGARVIPMGRNAGFSAAVNRGIRESNGEWIAVLNNDVELAPDYFEALLRADAWFATGKILAAAPRDRIDGTFDAVCRGGTAWRVGSGRSDGPLFSDRDASRSAPWTACPVSRRNIRAASACLEESFESYLEDVDFGLRCAARGFDGVYEPAASLGIRAARRLGAGIRRPCGASRAISFFCLRGIIPRHCSRRWIWPIFVAQMLWGAVACRHGAGFAWLRGKSAGLARISQTARQWVHVTDERTGQILLRTTNG